FQRFYETVAGFRAPQLWIPGNHDIVSNMIEAVGRDNPCLEKVFRLNQWLIIMLDTSVRGEVHGYLAPDELVFLDHQLKASGNQQLHVLICMHHNPMPVQARWLQNHSLKNEAEFFAVIDRYEHVKCVLWGHIHQDYDEVRKDVRMLASPSTCIQFHPDNDEFTLDDVNPGYRWLELKPGGDFKTGVERVTGRTFDIDFSSRGY
ncbi:MAG: metallophosphoesterase, partial [Pseudohongiellaceae bacterium]